MYDLVVYAEQMDICIDSIGLCSLTPGSCERGSTLDKRQGPPPGQISTRIVTGWRMPPETKDGPS